MKKLTTLLFILLAITAFAQKGGGVKGFVYDKANGEGIPFAIIKLDTGEFGATADGQGFFNIPNVPLGTYKLTASYFGYETQTMSVEIKKNQSTNVKFFMVVNSIDIKEVEISGAQQKKTTETGVSVTTITPMEMHRMPSVGGEADLAQYLPLIPGIISTGDQGGQVIIRGATPSQTQFLLDGIPVYDPFHSVGLFSVFETDIVKNVDVYTGGFPSQYGTRTGAVVDVSTVDGNKKDFSGKIGVSPFMAHALLEIPIIKLKEEGNTSASLILSSKASYLDQSAKIFYPYAGSGGLPYSFYDTYGKFTLSTNYGNKLSISGFDFRDNAEFEAANYKWQNFGVGGNFLAVPRNSNLFFNTHVTYSQYAVSLSEADNLPRSSEIGTFDVGMDFASYINHGELRYGLDVQGTSTNYAFTNAYAQEITQLQSSTDLNVFFTFHKYIKKFVVEAGFRFQYYGSITAPSPEPRLSLKYNATRWLRFKMATGLYSQNIISTTDNQDVVNLFNGFLTGTNDVAQDASGKNYTNIHNYQRSVDAIFGAEVDLPKNIELNIEPYYKFFWHVLAINQYKEATTDPDFLVEHGPTFGMDVLLKWNYKGFFFYATYSLAYAYLNDGPDKLSALNYGDHVFADGSQIYSPYYDRRHNVNLVASYDFGKNRSWEISARWNYGSSFPFTQTQSFYPYNPFSNGIGTNIINTNGNLGVVYATQINGGRLPAYSRLDLEAKKIITIKKRFKIEVNVSVSNAYDRDNIFYFDRITYTRVNQLPILPSLGLSFAW